MPHFNQQMLGTSMVLASAAGFATLAIFIKLAYAAGANIITILAVRFALAAFCLWLILYLRGISPTIDKKLLLKLSLMGAFGYGTMSLFFAGSLQYLPASLAAMILYAYPAIVSLLSFMLGDETFTWQKGSALAICFTGLILVLGVSFVGINVIGIFLGLGAATVYSCYILVGNRVLKGVNSLVATTYVCSAAAFVFTVAGLVRGELMLTLPVSGWLALMGISFLGTIVGILCFFSGMKRIGAAAASIISTTEPVITVLLSAIFLAEKITIVQASGGLLILVGILILQLWANTEKCIPLEKTPPQISAINER